MRPAYEWHHIITFEETNVVGNVYYANHIRWQGCCRELFLRDKAPEILKALQQDLVMVTTRVACDYYHELFAFDEIVLRMRAGAVNANRIVMLFDYMQQQDQQETLIAQGEQQVACLRKTGETTVPTPIPAALQEALLPYLIKN
ncbi:MAG: acyl-CoA thioesterase [Pseudomonadota bacterium]|nr:acyl-CoA thioesterase [Pseudomonadota bacterium]